jgi:hypothetical protein
MMARQDQSVEGGTAYQAHGNLTVTNGMDADQMAAVMVAMAKHLQVHFAEAEAKLEERLTDFRKAVLEEFAKPENGPATEAFKDPDFQFVLNDAQKVFARDGSPDLRDDLVKLLVQRSQLDGRDRVAKILNHSIELAGTFSKHEYAALAMNFLFTNVASGINTRAALLAQYSSFVAPFYRDLSDNVTVYEYIEAQRCGSINYVVTRSITEPLYKKYSSVLSSGFTHQQFMDLLPGGDMSIFNNLLIGTDNYTKPYRFSHSDPSELAAELRKRGLPERNIDLATSLHNTSNPNETQVQQIFSEEVEGFTRVKEVWDNTALSKMSLTAVGKTIAHSSLTSRSPFDAPLNIWVQ